MESAEDIKKNLEKLLKQLGEQFEEVKDGVSKAYDRGKHHLDRLVLERERDELLRKLGDQVHKLAIQKKVTLPDPVQRTISRIDKKVAEITKVKKTPSTKKTATAAPAQKKTPAKKTTAKKTTTKKATAKKAAKKAPAKRTSTAKKS